MEPWVWCACVALLPVAAWITARAGRGLASDSLVSLDLFGTTFTECSVSFGCHRCDVGQERNVDAQLGVLSPKASGPWEPNFRLDVLANQVLFAMVQGWQELIDCGGEGYALENPRFHELMDELVERGLMSADWKWTVDVEDVDMGFARVVIEHLDI